MLLASLLRQNQISRNSLATKTLALQQQLLLSRGGVGMVISLSFVPGASSQGGESGLRPLPLSLASADSSYSMLLVDRSWDDVIYTSFKSPSSNFSAPATTGINQAAPVAGATGGVFLGEKYKSVQFRIY